MKSDLTSNLLLATLSLKDQFFDTGATYRPTDESFNLACQYWQPPKLTYMNSGLNKYVTGVGVKLWDSSEACGQCLEVINGNKSVIVVIADYCPPPCTPMQLDLNPYASAALNLHKTQPRNYPKLIAKKVSCHWSKALTFYLDKGSSVYNWYLIPLFLEKPLQSVSVLGKQAYHDKYGRWVLAFKTKFPTCGKQIDIYVDKKFNTKIYFNC